MRANVGALTATAVVLCAFTTSGCFRIRTAPSCPEYLEVGETVPLDANERQPGAIPEYLWEVIPSGAAVIAQPDQPETTIRGVIEGEAVVRLTASDGLFQVINECPISIVRDASVTVAITVDPAPAVAGESVLIVCTSTGGIEATTITLTQVGGVPVTLQFFGEGAASFTPTVAGTLTFGCLGESPSGVMSDPVTVNLTVSAAPDGGRPPRGGR